MRGCAFVLITTLAACSLIDPLDDISGGATARDSGRPKVEDDDDDVVDASAKDAEGGGAPSLPFGKDVFGCSGFLEREPNNTKAQPNPAANGTICGALTSGEADLDVFAFSYVNATGTYFIQLEASDPNVVVKLEDNGEQAKSQTITNGNPFASIVTGSGDVHLSVSVTGKTTTVAYKLNVSRP